MMFQAHCTHYGKVVTDAECLACFIHPDHEQIRRLSKDCSGQPRRMVCVEMHLLAIEDQIPAGGDRLRA